MTKVLILGGGGFIGINIARRLMDDGGHEITLADKAYRGRLEAYFPDSAERAALTVIEDDFAEPQAYERLADAYDQVYMMAAIVGVNRTLEHPEEVIRVNTEAAGRYVAFLDADDWWRPAKLSAQLAFMERMGAVFAYTAYEKCDADGRLDGRVFTPPASASHERLLRSCVIGCSTVMLDQAVLGRRFMPPLPSAHDFALWLDILREGYEAHGLPEPLTVYRERGGSLSSNKLAKSRMTWHIYREREGLSRLQSTRLMLSYAWSGMRKRML